MATQTRDLSRAEFQRACKRQGFEPGGVLGGYVKIGVGGIHVYAPNGGSRRRAQLAYLIQERAHWLEKQEPDPLDAALEATDGDIDLVEPTEA